MVIDGRISFGTASDALGRRYFALYCAFLCIAMLVDVDNVNDDVDVDHDDRRPSVVVAALAVAGWLLMRAKSQAKKEKRDGGGWALPSRPGQPGPRKRKIRQKTIN